MGCWLFKPRRCRVRRVRTCRGDAVAPDAGRLQGDGGCELQRAGSVGEGADGTCAPLDFAVQAFEPVRRADALQHLVEHRLITVDGDAASESASREALVDLSHEALITG
jgi:hypothetical protein